MVSTKVNRNGFASMVFHFKELVANIKERRCFTLIVLFKMMDLKRYHDALTTHNPMWDGVTPYLSQFFYSPLLNCGNFVFDVFSFLFLAPTTLLGRGYFSNPAPQTDARREK